MRIVKVTWEDSCHSTRWQSHHDFKTFASVPEVNIQSVGFLAWEDERYVVIIQSGAPDNIDAMMKIPRCAIVELLELGESEVHLEPG